MACSAALANGGIVTDGTVGAAGHLGAPQTLSGSDVKITQDMGTTKGGNVFQSFKEFNIGSGQTVTFTENSAGSINNVIARVTGKETSNINGTLRVTPEGHANFYLLNPNGVLFGSGAHIDVPGDFHVTTAHFIKFQDGAKYGANPVHSELSRTEPASFGFTASTHSNNVLIDVTDGAQLKNPATPSTAIDLVAQNIKIENGATVSANDVRLVAAKGNTSVSLAHDVYGNLLLPKFAPTAMNAGKVHVDGDDTSLSSGGDGGGRVAVWGDNVVLSNNSSLSSTNYGGLSASPSDGIDVRGFNVFIDNGSRITSTEKGEGQPDGGNIQVKATNNITIKNIASRSSSLSTNRSIESITHGGGSAGSIYLMAGGRINSTNSSIISVTDGSGATGNIRLISKDTILNGSLIATDNGFLSSEFCMSCGRLGFINISDDSSLIIANSSQILSNNFNLINNTNIVRSPGSSGFGGGIKIVSPNIIIEDSSKINSATTMAPLDPVYVIANETISVINHSDILTHQDTPLYVYSSGNILVSGRSSISGFSPPIDGFKGRLSAVHLTAETLLVNDYAFIGSAASKGEAVGGKVYLNVEGLFSAGNILNGNIFTGGDSVIPRNPIITGEGIPAGGNQIGAVGTNANTVLTGSLLNLSGDMANLPPAKFKSKEIPNSCEVVNRGSLSLKGKDRKASSGLDRLIYGY